MLDRAWDIAPEVALRPEPFGALLYHYGTRRLSIINGRRLVEVVRTLATAPSARAACAAAGVDDDRVSVYEQALARLAESGMLQERTG